MRVAAFDPGRNVGFALLDAAGTLLRHEVLRVADVASLRFDADVIAVGAGTGCRELLAALAARAPAPVIVDETGTSLEGRRLYFRDHPAVGLARLVPVGMRTPPRPIDDYAAYAIGLRYLGLAPERASGPRRT